MQDFRDDDDWWLGPQDDDDDDWPYPREQGMLTMRKLRGESLYLAIGRFVQDYKAENEHISPSRREIAHEFCCSTDTVQTAMVYLANRGKIKRAYGKHRVA